MSLHDDEPTVRAVVVHGRRIEYVDVGDGPVLLLVHGTGSSWAFWRPTLTALARDFRVIAPSLPGHGASEPLSDVPFDLLPYADALVGLLDELGVPAAVAVGHSLGGLVCLRLALTHRRRVSALVLVDSGGAVLGRIRLRVVTGSLLLARRVAARPWFGRVLTARRGVRRLMVATAVHDPDTMSAAMLTESLWAFGRPGVADAIRAGAREQTASSAGQVRVATTIVWGRFDRVLPLRLGAELAEAVPRAALEVIDGSGHCPMIDRPDAFTDAVCRAALRVDTM